MAQLLILLVVALVVGGLIFGVVVLITGRDRGLEPAEPDSALVPLPTDRPLDEADLTTVRFDTGLRGYRMDQVDRALRRAGYDIGYKSELISVLEAEVAALRDGRLGDADTLRAARERAAGSRTEPEPTRSAEIEPEPATSAEIEPQVDEPELEAESGEARQNGTTDEPTVVAAPTEAEEDEWQAPSSTRR